MKKQFPGFFTGFIVAALLFSLIITASAAITGMTTIEVGPIKILVDGKEFKPTDVNGNPVDVFVYNGTTYAPLRALAESYGLTVGYDAEKHMATVDLKPGQGGTASSEPRNLMSVCPPYETNYGYYSANGKVTDGSSVFYMAGEAYTNGFKLDINRSNSTQAIFNLKGEYSVLKFDLGHVDETGGDTLNLKIILDGNIKELIVAKYNDLVKHYEIDISGAQQLVIEGIGQDATMWGSHYGLANITVS